MTDENKHVTACVRYVFGGDMGIIYDTRKDLPGEQLHKLFVSVGWSNETQTPLLLKNFNQPFINSTVVISAWKNDRLVGCVRAISDKTVRSVIYDLAVAPQYQNQGIGKELLRRCIEHFPNAEWLAGTTQNISAYYKKLGFNSHSDVFLRLPSKWF